MTKIGINGFGRIGRLVFRAICDEGTSRQGNRRRRGQRSRSRRQPRLSAQVRFDPGPIQRQV